MATKTNVLTPARLAAILSTVPEKKFRITDLAPTLLNANGRPDPAMCMEAEGEINLAVAEVNFYIDASRNVYEELHLLPSCGQNLEEAEEMDYEDD
jgi:hypothetical protein